MKPYKPIEDDTAHKLVTSDEKHRDAASYDAVIDQFDVGSNPRYTKDQLGHPETFCVTFAWDVTKAMGAEIPYHVYTGQDKTHEAGEPAPRDVNKWVLKGGKSVLDGPLVTREQDANAVYDWLEAYGRKKAGWAEILPAVEPARAPGVPDWVDAPLVKRPKTRAERAQEIANTGKPVVVVYKAKSGSGHIAVVRPGKFDADKGPEIAQAGSTNFPHGWVEKSLPGVAPGDTGHRDDNMKYWSHG